MRVAWVRTGLLVSCLTMACQETKLETSKPSSTSSVSSDKDKVEDEKVIPPVPVNGVWLNAQVLREKASNNSAEAQIGIATYYKGIKITDQRDRFIVTMSAAQNSSTSVSINQEVLPTGDFDQLVTLQGTTLDGIRSSYANIMLYVTVVDRGDNSSDTWNTSLDKVLTTRTSRTVTSSSSAGSAGSAGSIGGSGMPPPPKGP